MNTILRFPTNRTNLFSKNNKKKIDKRFYPTNKKLIQFISNYNNNNKQNIVNLYKNFRINGYAVIAQSEIKNFIKQLINYHSIRRDINKLNFPNNEITLLQSQILVERTKDSLSIHPLPISQKEDLNFYDLAPDESELQKAMLNSVNLLIMNPAFLTSCAFIVSVYVLKYQSQGKLPPNLPPHQDTKFSHQIISTLYSNINTKVNIYHNSFPGNPDDELVQNSVKGKTPIASLNDTQVKILGPNVLHEVVHSGQTNGRPCLRIVLGGGIKHVWSNSKKFDVKEFLFDAWRHDATSSLNRRNRVDELIHYLNEDRKKIEALDPKLIVGFHNTSVENAISIKKYGFGTRLHVGKDPKNISHFGEVSLLVVKKDGKLPLGIQKFCDDNMKIDPCYGGYNHLQFLVFNINTNIETTKHTHPYSEQHFSD